MSVSCTVTVYPKTVFMDLREIGNTVSLGSQTMTDTDTVRAH